MTESTTEQEKTHHDQRHGHCGPWGGHHNKMWMFGPMMAAKMAGKYGRRGGRYSRAQQWMDENPSDDQIIEFLEEYQRDLEEKIADVRTRIDDIKGKSE